jgi:hypothetical protein
MGYGQASDAPPLYSFEYPATWEEETVTKTDKSTMVCLLDPELAGLTFVGFLSVTQTLLHSLLK